MFNVILAMDNNNGIGSDNSLPWYFSQDLKLFKTLTTNNVPFQKNIVIMGRKTMETIPNKFLSERINIVISRSDNITNKNVKFVKSFSEALNLAYSVNGIHSQNIWVIGGAEIYNLAFRHRDLNKIYYSKIDSTFKCDTFVKLPKHKILNFYQYDDINKNDQKIYKLKYIQLNLI